MREEMSREEKNLIFTMGILEDARAKGLQGGRFRMTAEGLAAYAQLRKEMYRPTDKEIEIAFTLLRTPPDEITKEYAMHGKLTFKWSCAHIWLWLMLQRLLKIEIKW